MSDSDDDNFVRYGTALDPIEEDFGGTMSALGSSHKKKYIKLRRANVEHQRALTLCRLPWNDIRAKIPGLDCYGKNSKTVVHIPPPPIKKNKKKKSKAQKQQNYRNAQVQPQVQTQKPKNTVCIRAEEQGVRWNSHDICTNWQTTSNDPRCLPENYVSNYSSNEFYTNQGIIERDSSHQNYWDTAGTSQARKRRIDDMESISNSSQPPRKVARDFFVDTNYARVTQSDRQYPMEIEHSPVYSTRSNTETQAFMPIQTEPRAAKRPYYDNNERYQYHQLYDPENPSLNTLRNIEPRPQLDLRHQLEPRPQLDLHPQLDLRPELDLRDQMNLKRHANRQNYHDDQNLPNPSRDNYSYRGSANSDCRSLPGVNTPRVISLDSDDDFDARCSREMSYEPHTPVDSDNHSDFNENSNDRVVKTQKNTIKTDSQENSQSIRVGIQNVTPMTKKQMSSVHQAINKEIVKIGKQGKGPKFLGSAYKSGWILMICEDQKTRKWLEKIVSQLKPWPQANLSIMSNNAFPKAVVLSILIPSKEGVSIPMALELIRVQNPGLHTEHWKVFKILKVSDGDIVHLSVDNTSYETLKRVDFKVNLGIDKLTFWPKGRKSYPTFNKKSKRNISPIHFVKESNETRETSPVGFEEPRTPSREPSPVGNTSVKSSKKSRKRYRKRLQKMNQLPTIQENPPSQNWYPNLDASYASSEWVPY